MSGQKIGVNHEGRWYFGQVVKRTYSGKIKTYHVYVSDLGRMVEAAETISYGAACAYIGRQQVKETNQ